MQKEQSILPKVIIKNCDTAEEAILEFLRNGENSYEIAVNAIEYGIMNCLTRVPVAKLYLRNTDKIYQITLHRNRWQDFLNEALNYCIENEKYECCAKIKKNVR